MTSGIYQITNIANEKIYIGQSMNIERRLKVHLHHLGKNEQNRYLNNLIKDPMIFSSSRTYFCNRDMS